MLCTLFSRLGVSPCNLTTLPFFLGVFCCACLLNSNDVEAYQEGGVYTASVEQDASQYALDSLDFFLGDCW